jgi:hypothetical protein
MDQVHSQLLETISFCKKALEQLKDDKIDLNANFDKCLYTLEQEKLKMIDKYKYDQNKFIDQRVKAFKNNIQDQILKENE